jgi:carbamoyltransferase
MLLVAPVQEAQRVATEACRESAFGIEKLKQKRSCIPAVTHVDYSARVQTVDDQRHPLLHGLLTKFHERTGCAVLINTSFNVRSEPIVCTPEDALRCFTMTDIDVLVMGRHIVRKDKQRQRASAAVRTRHLAQFQLD